MAINALQLYFEPLSQFFKCRYCCGSQILRLSWQFSSGRCFQQYSKTTSIVLLYVIKLTVIQVWLFVFNNTTHSKCFSSYFVSFSIILYADFYQSIFFAHFCNLIFKVFFLNFLKHLCAANSFMDNLPMGYRPLFKTNSS